MNATTKRTRFAAWRHRRPFLGSVLTMIAGVEMFFSGQLDVGKIHVQVGVEGLQAMIIPLVVVLLGILAMVMPEHRIFYGVISLAISVYSLIGVNLGGFFIGMLLGAVGGVLIVSWMPKKAVVDEPSVDEPSVDEPSVDEPSVDTTADDATAELPPLVERRS
jgi:hypothetical protein